MGFIAKQPNGLYCRFSSVTDCPVQWNMTANDYIEYLKREAVEDAVTTLMYHLSPFGLVIEEFRTNNMTPNEFIKFLNECGFEGDIKFDEEGRFVE